MSEPVTKHKHTKFDAHNSDYDVVRCADCGDWIDIQDTPGFYANQFDMLMGQVKANNQNFIKLQGNDPLDSMDEEDVVEVQMGQYTNHIRKAFSDTLSKREGSKYYRQLELALAECYEQLTGESLGGEL